MGRDDRRSNRGKVAGFVGTWRIVETELRDVDALDLVEPAHITFEEDLSWREAAA